MFFFVGTLSSRDSGSSYMSRDSGLSVQVEEEHEVNKRSVIFVRFKDRMEFLLF